MSDASPDELSPEQLFHEGERAMQRRAGVADTALRVGREVMEPGIGPEFAAFLAQRLFLVTGAASVDGLVWTSLLVGPPGFGRAIDSRHLHVVARPAPGDPLAPALAAGPTPIGLLAIDQATRSRIRVNGTAQRTDAGILVVVEQVYGNCTLDSRIGMLVVDWEAGRTLQIAGRAEILWDGPEVARRAGADRLVVLTVPAVVEQALPLAVRFALQEAHPLNPPLQVAVVARGPSAVKPASWVWCGLCAWVAPALTAVVPPRDGSVRWVHGVRPPWVDHSGRWGGAGKVVGPGADTSSR